MPTTDELEQYARRLEERVSRLEGQPTGQPAVQVEPDKNTLAPGDERDSPESPEVTSHDQGRGELPPTI